MLDAQHKVGTGPVERCDLALMAVARQIASGVLDDLDPGRTPRGYEDYLVLEMYEALFEGACQLDVDTPDQWVADQSATAAASLARDRSVGL